MDAFELMDAWGPEKIVCVSDRRSGMRGVLVIDNTARGMGKGGTRMSAALTVREVARLARTMTWKWAAVDLFHGGAKAGIVGDPRAPGKEERLRAFARALANEVPDEYVFGLDMGLDENDAAVLVDALGDRGVAVGLPSALGGLPYDELGLTGHGVAEATEAAAQVSGIELAGARVCIQGFGAVGRAAAARLVELGAIVVGLATVDGAVSNPDGLELGAVNDLREEYGDAWVRHHPDALAGDGLLTTECDILIPAAREDVIDEALAGSLRTRLVVEAANLPTSAVARDVLARRGIPVVPDFIANAGGIIAAAHSMDARRSAFPVDPAVVRRMISDRMRANTTHVLLESLRLGIDPHRTARAIAEGRVRAAMAARGQVAPT